MAVPYAVYLDLDDASNKRLEALSARIESIAGEAITPRSMGQPYHITLAVYSSLNLESALACLSAFSAKASAMPVTLLSLGLFPGLTNVVFAAPVATSALLSLHASFHHAMRDIGPSQPYYLPDVWVPHVTLGMNLNSSQLGEAVARIAPDWDPIQAEICAVRLILVDPVTTLWHTSLA
ncbi:2'-5' RNA ligase family protein [Sphingomonas oleivorans]|nr:2'-5' RNA ligase family protein [Sphingomonas oleivorans]